MAQSKTGDFTYTGLKKFLGHSQSKILAHNTIAINEDDCIAVQYHDSIIARVYPDKIELSNGGWFTPTTRDRINWFLHGHNYRITQSNGLWQVYKYYQDETIGLFTGSCTYMIGADTFIGLQSDSPKKTMAKRIKQYCKDYIKALINYEIDGPSGGDCWFCHMNLPSFDHIESHMEENYFVPSLAMRASEYKPISIIAKQTIAMLWYKDQDIPDTFLSVLSDQLYKSMVSYLTWLYDQNDVTQ